jgi:hypothetical protein
VYTAVDLDLNLDLDLDLQLYTAACVYSTAVCVHTAVHSRSTKFRSRGIMKQLCVHDTAVHTKKPVTADIIGRVYTRPY